MLFDNKAEDYVDKDSIIISDNFLDTELDFSFSESKRKKYNMDFGAKASYRNFATNPIMNQFNASGDFEYIRIKKKWRFGVAGSGGYQNKIGTSVMGDAIFRSLIGYTYNGKIYIGRQLSKKSYSFIELFVIHKDFIKDTTETPLDYSLTRVTLKHEYAPNKKTEMKAFVSFRDRYDLFYKAADSVGNNFKTNPNRHFLYYKAGFDLTYKIHKKVALVPNVRFSRRKDVCMDFYSMTSASFGLKTRMFIGKLFLSAGGDVKYMRYDLKFAPTFDGDQIPLKFAILDVKVKAKYKIGKTFDAFTLLLINNRGSNAENHVWRTRRGYNHYSFKVGFNYNIVDRKFKR